MTSSFGRLQTTKNGLSIEVSITYCRGVTDSTSNGTEEDRRQQRALVGDVVNLMEEKQANVDCHVGIDNKDCSSYKRDTHFLLQCFCLLNLIFSLVGSIKLGINYVTLN